MGSDFNERIAEQIGVPVTEGVRLQEAIEGMGAAQAGLQGGDVIVEVGGQPLREWSDFNRALRGKQAGESLSVAFYRGAERHAVEMPLSARPIPATPLDPKEFARKLGAVHAEVMVEIRQALVDVSEHDADFSPDGEWSTKENLAHLIDGEEGTHEWLSFLMQDAEPQYPDSWQNSHERVRSIVRVTPTVKALLDRLEAAQAETVALYEEANRLRARKGVMWRLGMNSLHFPGEHEREHLAQILKTLGAVQDREPASAEV